MTKKKNKKRRTRRKINEEEGKMKEMKSGRRRLERKGWGRRRRG